MAVKHIALINLSIISGNKKWYSTKVDINGEKLEFKELAFQTNETALQYFCWKRAKQDSAAIDKVFAFATKKAQDLKCNKKEMENEDCFGKTSLEWLGESMPKYQNSLDINVTYKSFDDWLHIETLDESSVLQALVSLNKMVDAIQNYRKANNEDEIVVHIDLTGGQRYSTVMMMALIQLSKYSGIQIGDAVYSNMDNGEINDVKSLVEMYTLISGSEEFTTFGSVKQIEALFVGKETSKELTELIVAMKNVSEVFKVCGNKDSVNKVLKELKDKIEDYKIFLENNKSTDENGNSVDRIKLDGQEQFFSKLIPTIEREYAPIFKDNGVDVTKTIKWCLDRGMLQQALTLYSEWVPNQITGKNYGLDIRKINNELTDKKKKRMSNQQFLFKSYRPDDYKGKYIEDPVEARRMVFNYLFDTQKIEIKIPSRDNKRKEEIQKEKRELVIQIVGIYSAIVSNWRNSLNHADAESDGSNFSDTIENKIRESLNDIDKLLEVTKNSSKG